MPNYLKNTKLQQVNALLELGWTYRRIEAETGVRRETVSRYDRIRRAKAAKVFPGSEPSFAGQNREVEGSDPGSHGQRFYGAYSNRGRIVCDNGQADSAAVGAPASEPRNNSDFSREARSTWARLVRKIFEADPLTCGACGTRMRIVSFITDPRVVDRILRHRQSDRCRTEDPFESRAPPLSRFRALH